MVHNRTGANTNWGVGAALAQSEGDIGLFEVDEAWLPLLCRRAADLGWWCSATCRAIVSTATASSSSSVERGADVVRRASVHGLVVNADDPLLAGPGGVLDHARADSIPFGSRIERSDHRLRSIPTRPTAVPRAAS